MNEQMVSLEVSKLLKEKGFKNYWCTCWYSEPPYVIDGIEILFPKVTQSLAQKWIRETKNIHIEIYANASGWGWILTKTDSNGSIIKEIEDNNFFNTYEDAFEYGLLTALK